MAESGRLVFMVFFLGFLAQVCFDGPLKTTHICTLNLFTKYWKICACFVRDMDRMRVI